MLSEHFSFGEFFQFMEKITLNYQMLGLRNAACGLYMIMIW